MVTFKEDIPSCSPLEDTCTVYVQGDDIKIENTETKSKYLILFYGGGGLKIGRQQACLLENKIPLLLKVKRS